MLEVKFRYCKLNDMMLREKKKKNTHTHTHTHVDA